MPDSEYCSGNMNSSHSIASAGWDSPSLFAYKATVGLVLNTSSCGVWCCDGIGTGAVVPRGRLAFGGLAALPILATRRGDSFPARLKKAGFRFRLKGRVGSLGFWNPTLPALPPCLILHHRVAVGGFCWAVDRSIAGAPVGGWVTSPTEAGGPPATPLSGFEISSPTLAGGLSEPLMRFLIRYFRFRSLSSDAAYPSWFCLRSFCLREGIPFPSRTFWTSKSRVLRADSRCWSGVVVSYSKIIWCWSGVVVSYSRIICRDTTSGMDDAHYA